MTKFLIQNNYVLIGNVDYHAELRGHKSTDRYPVGGGIVHIDKEANEVVFYGQSVDYGSVTVDEFRDALNNTMLSPFFDGMDIYFSSASLPTQINQTNKIKIDYVYS